ncbi:MAG TPA: filamentous hemagglutinin N-terminal domain-containing protein [Burkholderiales bacterium]|nr:filamentous hemagglutinin N-terminal domain-containing protein [Burkholderiales bacterium]
MQQSPRWSSNVVRPRSNLVTRLNPVTAAVAAALIAAYGPGVRLAHAGPTGEQVVGGAATVQRPDANTTVINQSTQRAALNWNGFSIDVGQAVIFNQPNAASVALNRVVGPNPSTIAGSLQANGQVFLINPSGILFSKGASVDVAGLVASTANISNADFMAGRNVFSGAAGNITIEKGASIKAGERGYVALLANQVFNSGTLTASNGTVALAAGQDMVLDFHGDGLLSLKVNAAGAGAKIAHDGIVVADGGRVIMSAAARNALLDTVLNIDGIVQARNAVERNGAIYLEGGDSGVTRVAGTVDAGIASIVTNDLALTGTVKGADRVILAPSDATEIALGASAAGKLSITQPMLDHVITGGVLAIGSDSSGSITLTGPVHGSSSTWQTLSLVTGDRIADANADPSASIAATSLALRAVNGIGAPDAPVRSQVSNIAFMNTGAGGVSLDNHGALAVTSVAGITSSDAGNGGFNLRTHSPLTFAVDTTFAGDMTLDATESAAAGDDITVNAGVTVKSTGGNLTLRAGDNVKLLSGSKVLTEAAGKTVTLLSSFNDTDGAGAITLDTATIATNGGDIQLTGGTRTPDADPNVNLTLGSVLMTDSTLTSGAGKITITGASPNVVPGVRTSGGTIQSTSGAISITGQAGSGAGILANGVSVTGTAISSTDGEISIVGQGGSSSDGANRGVQIFGGATITTAAGGIKIFGTGGSNQLSNVGVLVSDDNTTISTTGTGAIQITGTGGAGSAGSSQGGNAGIVVQSGASILSTSTGAGAGGITLTGTGGTGGVDPRDYGVWFLGATLSNQNRVEAEAGSIAVTGTSANSLGVRIEQFGALGKAGMTGDILVRSLGGSGMSIAGNAPVFPVIPEVSPILTTGNLTLNASGGGSVSVSGFINASGLRLLSDTPGAAFSLSNGSNNVSTLAINAAGGSVTYRDADALAFGTVNSVRQVAETATTTAGVEAAGSLTITTGGDITQTSRVVVSGASSFNAGANSITLTDSANDFNGAVTLANSGAKDISIVDSNALMLNGASFGRNFTANAGGGDITIASGQTFTKSNSSAATMRLNASGDINVNSGVTIQPGAGALSIVLNADSDANDAGRVALNGISGSAVSFTSNGGSITLGGRAAAGNTVTDVATGNATNGEGVRLSFATLDAGAGSVGIFGKGGSHLSGSDGNNHGVLLTDSTVSANGGITIAGTGGTAGRDNYGVDITSNALVTTAAAGGITVTGTGGAVGGSANQIGIRLAGGADITSTGTGGITLNGTGGAGSTGNPGVNIGGSGTTITTASGNIGITGTGKGAGQADHGVSIFSSALVSTSGTGQIAINGTADGGTMNNIGVFLSDAQVTSTSADPGAGTITLTGNVTSGSATSGNQGVTGQSSATVSSVRGDIGITGTGGGSGTNNSGVLLGGITVQSSGAAALSITGTGAGSGALGIDVATGGGSSEIRNTAGAAPITLTADDMSLASVTGITNVGNTVTLRTLSAGRAITLGADTAGTLGLTNAELNKVTANMLVVGRSEAGALAVSSAIAPVNAPNLQLITGASAAINAGVSVIDSLTMNAGTDITVASGQTIARTGTGTGSVRFNAADDITLIGATIQQSGGTAGTDKLNVVFNANSDDAAGGGIAAISAPSVLTRGGDITFGGRDTTLTGAVTGAAGGVSAIGVNLSGATLDASGGSVSIVGQGGTTGSSNHGVSLNATAISGNGVSLRGTGGSGGSSNNGVVFSGGTLTSSGNIDITGTAGAGSSSAVSIGGATIGNVAMAGDILVRSLGGALALDGTIVNDRGAGHDVTINASGGSVTQSAGSRITAGGLRLLGQATSFDLAGTANDVTVLAGAVTAPVTLVNSQPLTIGTLTTNDGTSSSTTTGISTNGGALDVDNTGALTINAAVNTMPTTLGIAGGTVKLVSTGAIASDANGTITTAGSDSGGAAAGTGGDVLVRSTGAGDITLVAAINAKGGDAPVAGSAGGGGIVTVLNDSGAISVGSVDASAGGGFGGGAAGAIQLKSTGGAISQTSGSALAGGTLKVLGDSAVTLDESGNTVGIVAGSGSSFAFTNADSGGLTVGNLGATTSLGVTIAVANGISTTAGDVTLRASAGALTVGSGNVDAGGASALLYANSMSFTGTVTGNAGVTLAPAIDNSAIVLGATGGGKPAPLSLESTLLGQVRTTGALTIGSATSGPITLGGAIAGSPATWNTLSLVTGDTIGNAAGASPLITASALALRAANGIGSSATPLRTAVSRIAFLNSGAGGVAIDNTGALTLGSVADITSGSSAGSGALTLTAHSPITIASDLIQSGDITITAGDVAGSGDDLTVNAGVTVRSTGSAAGEGNVTLQAGDNMVLNAGSKVESRASEFSSPTGGKRVTLTAGSGNEQGTITGSGVIAGETVVLDALTGIGSSGTRAATSAATLAARTRTSGDVFVGNSGSVTLGTVDGSIVNGAAGGGAYDVTSTGMLTVGGAVNSTGFTGPTTLATNVFGNIVVNAALGNAGSTTTLTTAAFGAITGSGTATGAQVVLDADLAVGTDVNRLSTAAGTLAARTRALFASSEGSGSGVFISEADGVTLATVGGVANGTASAAAYDVISAGTMAIDGAVTTNGGAVTLQSTAGAITSTAAGTITTSASGVRGPVLITAATSIDLLGKVATKSIRSFAPATRGGDVTFSGPGGIAVSDIDTSGSGSDSIAGGAAAGDIAFGSPASITLRGNITARGGDGNIGFGTAGNGANLTFGAPVILAGDVVIDTRAGSNAATPGMAGTVTFSSTIDSPATARALTVTTPAQIAFDGAVGGTAALASLTTNGGGAIAVNGGGVSTSGTQTYDNTVTLGGAAGSSALFSGSALFFNGSPALVAGAHPLTLTTNALTLAGNVTGSSTLLIQPTGDTVTMGIAGGAGTLALPTATLNKLQDGFASTTFGRATSTAATTVNAVSFGDPVTIRGGSVTVNGDITGSDNASITISPTNSGPIALNANIVTASNAVALNGAVTLGANVSVDTTSSGVGANVTFASTVNADDSSTQDRTLTVNAGSGIVTFGGGVGAGSNAALADLDVNAGSIRLNGPIVVNDANAGAQTVTLNGPLTLGADVSINTDRAGANDNALVFGSTIDASNGAALTLDAGSAPVTFNGNIGAGINGALAALDVTTSGAINLNAATVNLSGGAGGATSTWGGNVLLGADATFTTARPSGASNNLTFGGTVNSATTARSLTVAGGNGAVTFGGDVGSTTALTALNVTAGSIALNGGQLKLDGGSGGLTSTLSGPVTLGADVQIDTDRASGTDHSLTFASTVNSAGAARKLEVLAGGGAVTFGGSVGGTAALSDLDVTAGAINLNAPTFNLNGGASAQTITFTGPVTLGANVVVNTDRSGAADSSVTFLSPISRDATSRSLGVTAGTGTARFSGDVGTAAAPLSDFDVAAGTILFRVAGGVQNTYFTGPATTVATLDGTVEIDAFGVFFNGTGGAGLTFNGNVRAPAPFGFGNGRHLRVALGSGTVTFASDIGDLSGGALSALNVSAGTINFNGTTVAVNRDLGDALLAGSVRFDGPVVLGAAAGRAVLMTTDNPLGRDASLTFTSSISGASHPVTIRAGDGSLTVAGATTAASLEATARDGINLGPLTTTAGATLTADSMALGTISAAGQTVRLRNFSANRPILLGGDSATSLSLSAAELGGVTAEQLVIGRLDGTNSGAITIGSDVNLGVSTLQLSTAGGVTGTAGGIVMPSGTLRIDTVGAVNITDAQNDVGTLSASAPGASLTFTDASALTLGSIDVPTAVSNAITVTAAGDLAIPNPVSSASGGLLGNVTLTSTGGRISGSSLITGNSVVLDSATGVGTGTGGRVNTSAATLAARSRVSGGVFVNEMDAATLNTIGGVTNSAAGSQGYDLVAGGAITVGGPVGTADVNTSGVPGTDATSGGITLLANGAIAGAGSIRTGNAVASGGAATSGSITLNAQRIGTGTASRLNVTTGTAFGGSTNVNGRLTATAADGIFLTSPSTLTLGALTTTASGAPIDLMTTGIDPLVLAGNLTTSNGAVSIGSAAQLAADVAVIANGGSVTFAGTVQSPLTPRSLTVTTNGVTTFNGAVGGSGNPLSSLTVDGGPTALNGGSVTTTGNQIYGALTLGADTTLTGDTPSFGGNVAGANNDLALDFSGLTAIDGARFGAIRNLAAGNGGVTALTGVLATSGTQTYDDNVTLSGNTTLAGTTPTFNGHVDGASNDLTLSFSGTTALDGARFSSIRNIVSSGPTTLTGALTTSGAQAYGSNVTLAGGTTLAGTTPTFGGNVDGANNDLTLSFSGTTTIDGAKFGRIRDLSSTGATTLTGALTTTGAQAYGGNVTLAGNTTLAGTTPTFGGNVDGASNDLTLSFSGTTAVDGARFTAIRNFASSGATTLTGTLTTTGTQTYAGNVTLAGDTTLAGTTTTFGGNVTGAGNDLTLSFGGITAIDGARFTAIRNLSSAGATTLTGALTTTGTQIYTGNVTLAGDTTLAGTTPTFGGAVDGANNDLTLNFSGTTAIDGARFANIRNLTSAGGGMTTLTGALTTTGTQIYNDDVLLAGNATLVGTTPTFGGNVDGANHDLTLSFNGATAIDGGRFTAIRDLASSGPTTLTGALTTSGIQTYSGSVVLAGNTTLAGTTPTFGGNVDGANNDLTLSFSGTTAIDGARFTGIRSLTTGNGGVTTLTGTLTTSGAQTYNDNVALAGTTVLNSGAGSITFAGTLESPATPRALTITSGNVLRFAGAVGGNGDALASLTTTASSTQIDGGAVTTTGSQTYNNPVVIGANASLDSTAGNISFGGALDADAAASNRTVVVNAPTGTVTFSGSVGANAAFADFDVISGPNTIVFNGSAPQTVNVTNGGDGTVRFSGNVRLDQSVAINTTGNNVAFANGVETAGATNRTLAVDASTGNVDLQAVGNATPLAMLMANGNVVSFNRNAVAQQIAIGASQILTNGSATIMSPLAFAGYDGPAALTLTGPASGGLYGSETTGMLRVDVPGLFVVTPNGSRALPTVWLQGNPAAKPFYQWYDDTGRREVVYNARPTSTPDFLSDPQQTRQILQQVSEHDIGDTASLRSADAAGAAREPDLCAAADGKSESPLMCGDAQAR